jgi:Zn-dependent metalloprotease
MREIKPATSDRTVYDAKFSEQLPGSVVRKEGEPATGDPAADEAYDGLGHTHRLYAEAFGRNSIDGRGLPLVATVHFGRLYDNAFWDGRQMVFGDGDGQVFERFTKSLSVIGHELAHGVTQYSAGLAYRNQAGALNESVSDVFGALVEQYVRKQSTAEASWLIGEGLFTEQVQGTALRSMKAPGTAYDDDVLGKDPQPDSMDGYVRTSADNGGVHLNSGIPNRAFCLVATALGGNAWDAPAQIWYETLTGGSLAPNSTFRAFAKATATSATELFGAESKEHDAVRSAWETVKVKL